MKSSCARNLLAHWCMTPCCLASGCISFRRAQALPRLPACCAIRYYPTTTREQSPKMGRITTLIEDGTLFADLGVPALDPATDRAMVCGSLAFNLDIKALMEKAGLNEGANSEPGEFVIEKAFVG